MKGGSDEELDHGIFELVDCVLSELGRDEGPADPLDEGEAFGSVSHLGGLSQLFQSFYPLDRQSRLEGQVLDELELSRALSNANLT